MARIVKVRTSATSPKPYEVRWSWYDANGKRHFKKASYRTEHEARAKKREVEDAVAAANLPDYAGGRQSVSHWGERWLAAKQPVLKPSTYRSYEGSGRQASTRPGALAALTRSRPATCRIGSPSFCGRARRRPRSGTTFGRSGRCSRTRPGHEP